MADTNTTNYALTKMQPGTHRDNWGDVANANLDLIDAAIDAAKDQAAAALPKAGGTVTSEITFQGEGVVPHWSDAAFVAGDMFLTPIAAPNPLTAVGQIWFGY